MKIEMLTVVLGILCLFLLTKMYTKDQQLQELKACKMQLETVTNKADSLEGELFPVELQLSRYQVAFTIFANRNPKAAEQYATIISEETE